MVTWSILIFLQQFWFYVWPEGPQHLNIPKIWSKLYFITVNQVWHACNKYQQDSQTIAFFRYLSFFKCKVTKCMQSLIFENELLTDHLWIKNGSHNTWFTVNVEKEKDVCIVFQKFNVLSIYLKCFIITKYYLVVPNIVNKR